MLPHIIGTIIGAVASIIIIDVPSHIVLGTSLGWLLIVAVFDKKWN